MRQRNRAAIAAMAAIVTAGVFPGHGSAQVTPASTKAPNTNTRSAVRAAAPWSTRPIRAELASGGKIAVAEWKKAENRSTCAPMGFAFVGALGKGATPRRANFSGGWSVAFDQPGQRSAFGIAGAGVEGTVADTARWPFQRAYIDGSAVGWGLEGDTGPGWLAYLFVSGQGCLYNVWSNLGQAHMEFLLGQIRYLDVGTAGSANQVNQAIPKARS